MPPPDDGAPAATVPPALSFEERRLAAADLSRHCAPERWAYLVLSVLSAGGLLILAGAILARDANWQTAITMFGSAGIIVASQGRVLSIWNKIASILMGTWR